MNLSEVKSAIPRNPAWVSSIITAASSLFIPFIIAGIGFLFGKLLRFSNQELESNMYGDFVAYLLTGITVAMVFTIYMA